MAESKPIPVRLDPSTIQRLDLAAERMGTNRAALIRFLVKTFVDHFETEGEVASLPSNWREIMRWIDGRSRGQQSHAHTETAPHLDANQVEPVSTGEGTRAALSNYLEHEGYFPKEKQHAAEGTGPTIPPRTKPVRYSKVKKPKP